MKISAGRVQLLEVSTRDSPEKGRQPLYPLNKMRIAMSDLDMFKFRALGQSEW